MTPPALPRPGDDVPSDGPPCTHQQRVPQVLTVEEAAKLLRISRGLAFTAVRTGAIPHLRIGRRILIPAHRLRELLGTDDPAAASPADVADPGSSSARQASARDALRAAALRELADTLEQLAAADPTVAPQRAHR